MTPTALFLAALLSAPAPAPSDAAKEDLKKLQGEWAPTAIQINGEKAPDKKLARTKLVVKDDKFTALEDNEVSDESTARLDPAQDPKAVDLAFTAGPDKDKSVQGIYKLDGNVLTVCVAEPGKERPKELSSAEGSGQILLVFKRAKP